MVPRSLFVNHDVMKGVKQHVLANYLITIPYLDCKYLSHRFYPPDSWLVSCSLAVLNIGCQRCNIFSSCLRLPVQEQVLCLTWTWSNKSILKMPGPILNTTCVDFSLFSQWTTVLFPAGMVSNTIQTGRLLPAPVIKGQWCVIVIWVRAGVERGKELDLGNHAKTSVHIMNLPLVLITYWCESFYWQRLFS